MEMEIINNITRLLLLLPCLTVHEFAHGWSAAKLGDDTATLQGRLTLNPLAHIDPLGTLILPLIGFPIGWAKPVPVNPARFDRKHNMRWAMMLTALAGPGSNILMAILVAMVIKITLVTGLGSSPEITRILYSLLHLNLLLALFNMLPIPPLDGSRVADYFMPQKLRPQWEKIYNSGPLFLFLVIIISNFFHVGLFSWLFSIEKYILAILAMIFQI